MKSPASDAGASMRHDGQHTARPGCPAFNRDWLDLQVDFVREVLGVDQGTHAFSSVMSAMRPCPVHYRSQYFATACDGSRRSLPVPADGVYPGCGHGSMRVPERCLQQLRDVPLNGHEE